MIIQSVAVLDQFDKDIIIFAMRVREWYLWHFLEIFKVMPENIHYAQVFKIIPNKAEIRDEH